MPYRRGPTAVDAPLGRVFWARLVTPPPAGATWQRDEETAIPLFSGTTIQSREYPRTDANGEQQFDKMGNPLIDKRPFKLSLGGAIDIEYGDDIHDPFPGALALFTQAGGAVDANNHLFAALDNGTKPAFTSNIGLTPSNSYSLLGIEVGAVKKTRVTRVIYDPGTFITTAAGGYSINLSLSDAVATGGAARTVLSRGASNDVYSGTTKGAYTTINGTWTIPFTRNLVSPAAITQMPPIIFDFEGSLSKQIELVTGKWVGFYVGFAGIGAGAAGSSSISIEFREE